MKNRAECFSEPYTATMAVSFSVASAFPLFRLPNYFEHRPARNLSAEAGLSYNGAIKRDFDYFDDGPALVVVWS
jgi:hypothetical protein